MANSVDPGEIIWVYTVCKGLSVSVLRITFDQDIYLHTPLIYGYDRLLNNIDIVQPRPSFQTSLYITKTCLFKYIENFTTKKMRIFR